MTTRILIVSFGQDTAQSGVYSQYRKIRTGNELDLQLLDVATCINEAMHGPGDAQKSRHSGEYVRLLLRSPVEGIREEIRALIRKAVAHSLVATIAEEH